MNKEDYVSLQVAKLLKEKGFDWRTNSMFCKVYRIKDEIIEKYPGLSDDDYYALFKDNGDNLSRENVYDYYIEPVNIPGRNLEVYFISHPSLICARPTLYEAQKWIRLSYGIYVYPSVYLSKDNDESCIYTVDSYKYNNDCWEAFIINTIKYETYEEALNAGILEVLKLI